LTIADDHAEAIMRAAHLLIGTVRMTRDNENQRGSKAELEVRVDLTEGGSEHWIITIECMTEQ
jgi:hypothetical protein